MNQKPKSSHCWCHLHGSTYVVLLLAAAVVFFLNVPGQYAVHIDPLEPSTWGPFGANAERIEHGWPWAYLVREGRYHDDSVSGERRPTRIWSFTEDFAAFWPWKLAADSVAGCVVLAGCVVAFDYWRRRRHRIWQLHLYDLFALTALVAAALWYALATVREFEREVTLLRRAGIPLQQDGTVEPMVCYMELARFHRTRGGPSWLRELWGDDFPRWWDRTIVLDVGVRNASGAELPELRVASILFVNQAEMADFSALGRLTKLKVLKIENAVIPPEMDSTADDSGNKGTAVLHGDRDLPRVLGYLKNAVQLEGLSLSDMVIGESSGKALGELRHLRFLELERCDLCDQELRFIARLPRLEELVLDEIPLSDKGLRHLTDSNIRRLSLLDIKLSTEHLKLLASVETLEELQLICSQIDSVELARLARLPRLRRLKLMPSVEPAALARLQQDNPALRIINEDYVIHRYKDEPDQEGRTR